MFQNVLHGKILRNCQITNLLHWPPKQISACFHISTRSKSADLPNIRSSPKSKEPISSKQPSPSSPSINQDYEYSPTVKEPEPVLPQIRNPDERAVQSTGTIIIAPGGVKPRHPNFDLVFKYPHIVKLHICCRLKLYQTAFIVCMYPASLVALREDILTPSQVAAIGGLNLAAFAVLMVVGEFFRKFVGMIYLRHDHQKVIISHLTFLGSRKDESVFLKDIVPLSESPENEEEIVWKLHLYDGRSFYISSWSGGIVRSDYWEHIFGTRPEEQSIDNPVNRLGGVAEDKK